MRLLVPVDGSRCARRAIQLIAGRGLPANIELLVWLINVQPTAATGFPTAAARQRLRQHYEAASAKILRPASAALRAAGIAAETLTVEGRPGPRIARVAKAKSIDLIVMGAHGRSALAGVVLGSVTNAVLALCETPVLLLRDVEPERAKSLRVGIAVDGGPYGVAAVEFVLRHREWFGPAPRFALIHVAPELPARLTTFLATLTGTNGHPPSVQALRQEMFERAMGAGVRLFEGAGVEVEQVQKVGDAGSEIAAYAQSHFDLLVMGSHGYDLLTAAVLGSVATKVAARCATPLLLIRKA